MRLRDGQAFAETGRGPRSIVLIHGEQSEPVQGIASQEGRVVVASCQGLLQPHAPFLIGTAKEPEDR